LWLVGRGRGLAGNQYAFRNHSRLIGAIHGSMGYILPKMLF